MCFLDHKMMSQNPKLRNEEAVVEAFVVSIDFHIELKLTALKMMAKEWKP